MEKAAARGGATPNDLDSLGSETAAERITVVIVDDDPLVRRVIRGTLERGGMDVVAEGSSGWEAVELTARHEPDIVLMDIVMSDMDGIAATRAILAERPQQAVILLTAAYGEDMAVVALRSGACGFLTKDLRVESLPRTLGAATEGEPAVTRRTVTRLIEHLREAPAGRPALRPIRSPLTPREWEILMLVGDGRTNEQIAAELVISIETVRSHVKHILRKLGVSSRRDARAAALRLHEEAAEH